MCGLTLCVTALNEIPTEDACLTEQGSGNQLLRSLQGENRRRGPDSSGIYRWQHCGAVDDTVLEVTLASSVLGLRGRLTSQPLIGERGVLAWNGQVFSGLDMSLDDNDTRRIFAELEAGVPPEDVFGDIEGPFAYVYLSFASSTIHFGLDPLSRRSLLLRIPDTSPCEPTADETRALKESAFILTSCRSPEARSRGLDFKALDGGKTGLLDLKAIRVENGIIDTSSALRMWTRTPLRLVNRAIPPLQEAETGTAAAEVESLRFVTQLTEAVQRRVQNIPQSHDGSPRVAILFSGGVDCSLLAALVHRCLPVGEPVELVNVAFEQPRSTRKGGAKRRADSEDDRAREAENSETYDVPDRLSGREAVAELRQACPGRDFRFVEVDVDITTSKAHRQVVIDLMYPSNTEMDLSLAYPLYFASRGTGILRSDVSAKPYQVAAKVYLSGLGADEQLAGYTRHRRAFDRGSWQGLIEEVQLDLDRLPQRNLSRDDRIISSHARDARYPFLDLAFVDYVSSLPMWTKCNLALTAGVGDKLLIRLAAKHCGLNQTSARVKRAMQFGTKSAKLNDARVKGGHRAGEEVIREAE